MKELLENKMFRVMAGVTILVILVIIIVVVLLSSGNKSITEATLASAAKAYYEKNTALLPKENYDSATVSLSTLIASGLISNDKEGASCPSYATVTNMNGVYEYTGFVRCNTNTNTVSLMSKLTASMTNTGSGFYNVDGKFIFRGENPNNYVKFADTLWRIIGLDENNNIKMIYQGIYYNEWDDRYNNEEERDKGINDYMSSEKSRLKEFLDGFFSTNDRNIERFTATRLSRTTKFTTCIGKADIESGNINICDETITERVSTITIEDYLNASLDESCSLENTINCRNYNFLNTSSWTITAYSNNSYQAYAIDDDEGLILKDAYIRSAIRPVIALKNDVIYASGSGTETDPYMIG